MVLKSEVQTLQSHKLHELLDSGAKEQQALQRLTTKLGHSIQVCAAAAVMTVMLLLLLWKLW